MGHSVTFQASLSQDEFESFSKIVLLQARRMDTRQMLDLADELHGLIRSRQAVERGLARHHMHRSL